MKKIKVLVSRTAGTNCDQETVHALRSCGAQVDLVHLGQLVASPKRLLDYSMWVIPGGFSYGDDVAAGKILANELKYKLPEAVQNFVREGRLLIGICNGFQVLVKLGLLPSLDGTLTQTATLAHNTSGRFQCQWVGMKTEKSRAQWLNKLPKKFELPMAHGEGKFIAIDKKTLNALEKNKQVVFRYAPKNPNGSQNDIAGICNVSGNVVGLMPHPERYVSAYQHPNWGTQKANGALPKTTVGLMFWQQALRQALRQASRRSSQQASRRVSKI